MYPPKFDYYRATSVNDAISLMQQHPGAQYLAGGHSLIPVLNLRLSDPGTLIDIGRIDTLKGIMVDRGSGLKIGALTTHKEISVNPDVPDALAEAASKIGDPQVRNRGTIGGNVCHADPASDLPTVLFALNASFEISGPGGSRTLTVEEFFVDMFETAMQEDEILAAVRIPAQLGGSAYTKLANPASRYAMVGAAAAITLDQGVCIMARVAVGSLTPKPVRATSVESALLGKSLNSEAIANAAQTVQNDLGDTILGDIHAGSDYRRAMANVFVKRAVEQAVMRAG